MFLEVQGEINSQPQQNMLILLSQKSANQLDKEKSTSTVNKLDLSAAYELCANKPSWSIHKNWLCFMPERKSHQISKCINPTGHILWL